MPLVQQSLPTPIQNPQPFVVQAPISQPDKVADSVSSNDSYKTIKSPIIGTFYRKPSPDKDAFVNVGDTVEIVGLGDTQTTTVTGVEMFQKTLDSGMAGDNVGILLRGVQKDDIDRGMVLSEPGTITPHTEFEGEVYILTKEEGGRHTPFFTGYRPQFYVRTTDVTGNIKAFTAEDGTDVEMVMPGDRIKMTAELISPIAIEAGMRFAIREGGRTIGAGVVSKILT